MVAEQIDDIYNQLGAGWLTQYTETYWRLIHQPTIHTNESNQILCLRTNWQHFWDSSKMFTLEKVFFQTTRKT